MTANAGVDVEKHCHCHCWPECTLAYYRNDAEVPQKTQRPPMCDPAIPLLDTNKKDSISSYRDTCLSCSLQLHSKEPGDGNSLDVH